MLRKPANIDLVRLKRQNRRYKHQVSTADRERVEASKESWGDQKTAPE
jgi:hypothetical protein